MFFSILVIWVFHSVPLPYYCYWYLASHFVYVNRYIKYNITHSYKYYKEYDRIWIPSRKNCLKNRNIVVFYSELICSVKYFQRTCNVTTHQRKCDTQIMNLIPLVKRVTNHNLVIQSEVETFNNGFFLVFVKNCYMDQQRPELRVKIIGNLIEMFLLKSLHEGLC